MGCSCRFQQGAQSNLESSRNSFAWSDIVYSRDLQAGAIRKLQLLLKRIRLGIDPETVDTRVQQMTARFDSAHESVVRTPVLAVNAPVTPLPAVIVDRAPATPPPVAGDAGNEPLGNEKVAERSLSSHVPTLQCKNEQEFADLCAAASEDVGDFGEHVLEHGLVRIDSSSGSDFETDSSSDSDSSTNEHLASAVPKPAYTESVPDGLSFHVHKKSRILHKSKRGEMVAFCKTKLNQNFSEIDRVFQFKFPKCMRCFVTDNNRITSCDALVGHLDEASKRRKRV